MSAAWLVTCIVLDIAVIIANFIEQLLIYQKWQYLDRIDHLLLSLSISDIISGIATLGIDSWFLARENGHISDMVLHEHHNMISKIFDSVFLFSVFASIFHVIAVAIERLYAIRFPRRYYIFTTFKFKFATISTVWIAALALTPTFAVSSLLSAKQVGSFIRGTVFLTAAIIVFITYIVIAYYLVRQRKSIIQDFSPDCSLQEDRLKRLTTLCLFLGISFVVCILPITLGYFSPKLYHPISSIMITLNSFINPCVYFVKVYYETRNITRSRSDTTHALLDHKGYAYTVTTETNYETDVNENGGHHKYYR
ncbi:G-protein coupled receptor 3-like [Hydractinia symbiolongicarpus]|uniref:G-protein coupled receptor 3-like n=1 Tax=Hydractinia symbiolongicarpus TaxID=13093 RepID=UPI002549FF33|nr:G-protein coupled receptor 3-like [Hydractinia symbiolongicarpus]XP_057291608.1 G-protein coupled receptor 3-like [Hydractinia symbiolongicarpus]XP_057291609.1 G-protein coupled receptor 3-like [Hydractinia symbiolongicarpus]XP_057291610.1 G-protein coupled receptor 3-like [Hydractinia symbiolongicarpus]